MSSSAPTKTAWPFDVKPLTEQFGAELSGIDLGRDVSEDLHRAVYEALLAHQVVVARGQDISPQTQVDLARHFGEVQVHVMNQYHAGGFPELYFLSNLDEHGQPSGRHPDRGTLAWHTDGSWRRRTGLATLMCAIEIPERGGETHFADMYQAYEALDDERRQTLGALRAVHNLDFSRTRRHGEEPMTEAQRLEVPPVDHPVVRTHPETGRKCIFLGDHAEYIAGMDYAEGRALIEALNAEAVAAAPNYAHHWQPGDLVIWDNRCTQHRATTFDTARDRRVIRRCTVLGDKPY